VHLVSAILQKATGKPAREFANENVFKPLGISEATLAQWGTDPQGISTGGYGLYLTPRDMAKLGFLYLNGGKWDGKQIVPAEYVAASTTQHTTKEDGSGYGYLWTVYPSEGRYAALGFAGQQIHVVPDLGLVVVFTAGLSMTSDPNLLDDLLKNYILPSAKSTSPLPAKPAGATQLETCIRIAANPQRPAPALPKIARDISGKTYTLDDTSLGLQTFALTFQEGQDTASVSTNGTASVNIGLNNLYSIQESPDGLAGALRGYWENENTFIVEELRLGNLPESEYRLIFTGDEVTLTLRERLFGGAPFEVHGVRQD
jgi:hypothetical protein